MYLDKVFENDPAMLKATLELHQQGKLPTNSWVINLDQIAENAKALSSKADQLGLETYVMSKQHNRNPYINALAQHMGLGKVVAVDFQGALAAGRYGIPVGHVGHLNQIPRTTLPAVMALSPDIITVFSVERAQMVDKVAADMGIVQDIMLRFYRPGDVFFDGQEGGFPLEDLDSVVAEIEKLKHVKISGVTAFPCLTYNGSGDEKVQKTPNIDTIHMAVKKLKARGHEISQLNMPGNTGANQMEMLKEAGATHVEPGNALIGTTPDNAFFSDLPEKVAFTYVSEVSHIYEGRVYAHGGGVYHTNYADEIYSLIGSDWEYAKNNQVFYKWDVVQDIDYHMQYLPKDGQECKVGDSVVSAYRTQMHMTRSYVVPVSGMSGKRPLKVHYIFDNATNALDNSMQPVNPEIVKKDIAELLKSY